MNLNSIKPYLRHYGRIRTLRGSVVRSTFARVQAGFDAADSAALEQAMKVLEQSNANELTCVYCGSTATCWDHLLPAARGGTHQVRNLAPCCLACNASKGARTWQEFLDEQPETEPTRSARAILERYTDGFQPKATCVSAKTTTALARILEDILAKMAEADALIEADLRSQAASDA